MRVESGPAFATLYSIRILSVLLLICPCAGHAWPDDAWEAIFDGSSLDGWKGDPAYWRVENGTLIGEVTPETLLERNSWLLWQGEQPRDFELELDYRISDRGNSGVCYRCQPLPDEPFSVRGYQADIDGGDNWTGINYEERGRTFLALRGMRTLIRPGERPEIQDLFGRHSELQRHVMKGGWNHYRIVVAGQRLRHYLNGVLMTDVTDLDPVNGNASGYIGVQVHVGPPMTVAFRDIRIKRLPRTPSPDRGEAPSSGIQRVTRDNSSSLRHLQEQAERLVPLTPPAH